MPVFPSFKIQVSNPNTEDLSGFPFPIRLPQSLWQYMRGTDPWDADELDNMNLGSDGYIMKWPELDDFWALAKLDTAYPEDMYAYYGPGAGCDPQDVFSIWRDLDNEDIGNELVGTLEEGMTVVSEAASTEGNFLVVIVNNSNGQAFIVNRNFYTGETSYTYFGEDNPAMTTGIYERMSFAIRDGYFEIRWFDDTEGEWQDFVSGIPLQNASIILSGNAMVGKVYNEIKELPEGVTYDWYDYNSEEQYPWVAGEVPWLTSMPSIDSIIIPQGVEAGTTFRIEVHTTDVSELEFLFNGVTYTGILESEGVFYAMIEAPFVSEETTLNVYVQAEDMAGTTQIVVYPAIPKSSRVSFLKDSSEIKSLVMETGQTAFIDVLVEKKEQEWEEAGCQLEASIVSFDGQEFEEMAVCNVDGKTVRVEADLPIGVYFLQTVIQLDPPLSYERVQRLKLKVVIDRK
ncbi:hypothetical protein [Mesotoga prima]|uniref:hypothetical protein n=1 Tax=Mesotoga prima TaxID=1184387 RepID=UPI002FE072E3